MADQNQLNDSEYIEGLEGLDTNIASSGWGDYPLDSVFVRTESRTAGEVVSRIEKQRYVLDPDFQRDFVWPIQKQSKLIESCVMRIPLPVFYVAEAPDGRIIVVDGLQRLTTFARFVGNQLKIGGLGGDGPGSLPHPLDGKYFDDLSINLRERILDTPLTLYILDAKAPERAKLDIFERVNSGEPLTRQQMRNALYNGKATVWLKQAAEGAPFRSATGLSLNSRTMRDREAINRFCAFKLLGRKTYTGGDMDEFLAKGLQRLAMLTDYDRDDLRENFDDAMLLNRRLFNEHAFRKSLVYMNQNVARSVINISLFEVCSVTLSSIEMPLNEDQTQELRLKITELLRNENFIRAVTYSTNSTLQVRERFQAMEQVVQKVVQ